MKILGLLLASAAWLSCLLVSLTVDAAIAESTVNIQTEAGGPQIQFTRVGIELADLKRPHILRVGGLMNQTAIPMTRVEVKLNGKVIKTIQNSSLELDLAPMMTTGRYEVAISGTTAQRDATISLNFSGINTQVNQQSSGSGEIEQRMIINVR